MNTPPSPSRKKQLHTNQQMWELIRFTIDRTYWLSLKTAFSFWTDQTLWSATMSTSTSSRDCPPSRRRLSPIHHWTSLPSTSSCMFPFSWRDHRRNWSRPGRDRGCWISLFSRRFFAHRWYDPGTEASAPTRGLTYTKWSGKNEYVWSRWNIDTFSFSFNILYILLLSVLWVLCLMDAQLFLSKGPSGGQGLWFRKWHELYVALLQKFVISRLRYTEDLQF